MIFLNGNVLLKDKLTHDNIKPRLLGHWGTCPGLNMVYAHLNRYATPITLALAVTQRYAELSASLV